MTFESPILQMQISITWILEHLGAAWALPMNDWILSKQEINIQLARFFVYKILSQRSEDILCLTYKL